ncbi:MAG: hypothetical protein AAF357_07080, partial [Verrucomicrobiota bacterium]
RRRLRFDEGLSPDHRRRSDHNERLTREESGTPHEIHACLNQRRPSADAENMSLALCYAFEQGAR